MLCYADLDGLVSLRYEQSIELHRLIEEEGSWEQSLGIHEVCASIKYDLTLLFNPDVITANQKGTL